MTDPIDPPAPTSDTSDSAPVPGPGKIRRAAGAVYGAGAYVCGGVKSCFESRLGLVVAGSLVGIALYEALPAAARGLRNNVPQWVSPKAEMKDVNGDGFPDLVQRCRGPFRDTVYLADVTPVDTNQPNGPKKATGTWSYNGRASADLYKTEHPETE